jgi:hypothetical protein
MRLSAMGFRVMPFRAPPVSAPAAADIGHPTAESQQAGLDHLIGVAVAQAAARLLGPVADRSRADGVRRTAPNPAVPGDDRDGTPET